MSERAAFGGDTTSDVTAVINDCMSRLHQERLVI